MAVRLLVIWGIYHVLVLFVLEKSVQVNYQLVGLVLEILK
nr:MAG TPA: hypothetical protein [Caudoviricetes sp.]